MENSEKKYVLTLTRDDYRNLQAFLKSLNMVRLSETLDTDIISIAISDAVRIVNEANEGVEEEAQVSFLVTQEVKGNLDIFLRNLNVGKLSNGVDTVTLSVAIVQLAQALQRAEEAEEEPKSASKASNRAKAPTAAKKSAPTPIRSERVRGEVVGIDI